MITESRELPHPTTAVPGLIVSLDFELRWGIRDLPDEVAYRQHILAVREIIPGTLRLFREYDIHATWATVGMLLFDSKQELLKALPETRPTYDNSRLDPYADLDQVGANEKSDPLHFGRSLAAKICETPGQELASHTFSHYYCLESGQSPQQFHADMVASVEANRNLSGAAPRSIVFPRNQCSREYIDVCRELGVDVYRGTEPHWAYQAKAGSKFNTLPKRLTRLADTFLPIAGNQPVRTLRVDEGQGDVRNVPSSRFFRPRFPGAAEPLRIRRITTAMRDAIRSGHGFHLWWHPHNFGRDVAGNLASLKSVLDAFDALRRENDARTYTMTEFAEASCP